MRIWEPQKQRVIKFPVGFVILWCAEGPRLEEVVLFVENGRVGIPYVQHAPFGNAVFSTDFC